MSENEGSGLIPYKAGDMRAESLIRSLAGAIPYIGTGIGEALTYNLTKVREKRLEEAFKKLSELISQLGEDKIDKEYVKSEDFQHLLVTCLESVLKTKQSEKRDNFAKLLTQALTTEKTAEDRVQAEWFAETLGRMSYYHLQVFKLLRDSDEVRQHLLKDMRDIDNGALSSCLQDLKSAGFVSFPDEIRIQNLDRVELTKSGKKFMEWVIS